MKQHFESADAKAPPMEKVSKGDAEVPSPSVKAAQEPEEQEPVPAAAVVAPEGDSNTTSTEPEPEALDIAKSESVLNRYQVLPGLIAHTAGNLVGAVTLTAGWAVGKADAKFGNAKQASDSSAFKMGFKAWLYANGIWPTVLCETGPYGNDFGPLPQDQQKREAMLRSTPLIVSNHVSYLDTVVLPLVLEVPKLMAMAEVASWPLFGQLCKEMDMIWVDRASPESRQAAKQAVKDHVQEWHDGDRPLLIWPEGTTSNGRGLKEFKNGAFVDGAPVRPVIIKYTGEWDPANVSFREATGEAVPSPTSASSSSPNGSEGTNAADKYGDVEWAEQFLGHVVHSCTVLICRPYRPSAEEKADPELYKANVRELMRQRLQELTDREEKNASKRRSRRSSSGQDLEDRSPATGVSSLIGGVDRLLQSAGRRLSEASINVQEASSSLKAQTLEEIARLQSHTEEAKTRLQEQTQDVTARFQARTEEATALLQAQTQEATARFQARTEEATTLLQAQTQEAAAQLQPKLQQAAARLQAQASWLQAFSPWKGGYAETSAGSAPSPAAGYPSPTAPATASAATTAPATPTATVAPATTPDPSPASSSPEPTATVE